MLPAHGHPDQYSSAHGIPQVAQLGMLGAATFVVRVVFRQGWPHEPQLRTYEQLDPA